MSMQTNTWAAPATLDQTTVAKALADARIALAAGATQIDLALLKQIDSSAVALLVSLKREQHAAGKPLQVIRAPASLQALAQLYEVSSVVS
jgi:phospholipid transport system transporter-binding protein